MESGADRAASLYPSQLRGDSSVTPQRGACKTIGWCAIAMRYLSPQPSPRPRHDLSSCVLCYVLLPPHQNDGAIEHTLELCITY